MAYDGGAQDETKGRAVLVLGRLSARDPVNRGQEIYTGLTKRSSDGKWRERTYIGTDSRTVVAVTREGHPVSLLCFQSLAPPGKYRSETLDP